MALSTATQPPADILRRQQKTEQPPADILRRPKTQQPSADIQQQQQPRTVRTKEPHTEELQAEPAHTQTQGAEPWARRRSKPVFAGAAPTPWWLSSDAEHAHTACPLRPFAHMVVALDGPASDGASSSSSDGACGAHTIEPPITAARLAAASVVHLSEALRRKMHAIAPGAAGAATVGDMMALSADDAAQAPAARMRAVSSGLWHMLGWLVGAQSAPRSSSSNVSGNCSGDSNGVNNSGNGSDADAPLSRRRRHARAPSDDPLLVGNEGLGAVELAAATGGKHACMFALCAHALSPTVQSEWRAWHAQAAPRRPQPQRNRRGSAVLAPAPATANADAQLAIVHVAEVSTLHRVACHGIDFLVPPPLPLEQYFGSMLDTARPLGPPPMLPPLLKPDAPPDAADARIRWMSLLVSRHGLVEMAFPLSTTLIAPLAADLALDTGPPVALGSYLGESIFSRIHPEDVARVVKALRLAWDARPDVYHFSRLRREWQRRRLSSAGDRAVASAPSTPPLRPQRAATLSAVAARDERLAARQVFHQDGIEVSNGVVELNIQIQLSGTSAAIDWDDADSMSEHTRFARMKLTRWPLILKPPRASSAFRSHAHPPEPEEPQDGFVLVGVRPLPEPSRTRSRSVEPADAGTDLKKRSISSVTSTSTLIGFGASTPSMLDSAELVRLCRSTSSLSCQETTARPSIEFSDASLPRGPASGGSSSSHVRAEMPWSGGMPIPVARPVVGLSNNAVQTATAMSPHLTMRRRSNIPVGSHPGTAEDGLGSHIFGTPRAFDY
ncbi:hypothetical protein IWW50_002384 [Coemansia erecta]|nr:hypothetical protein GGF43_001857 [Coemansia sp. RSA 2618]KAJ2826385.1 hypothetical protein IWW50_002384 [Coemansia erecta]